MIISKNFWKKYLLHILEANHKDHKDWAIISGNLSAATKEIETQTTTALTALWSARKDASNSVPFLSTQSQRATVEDVLN